MERIGITGGIGSGKSVVSCLLRVMGYPVYDTDIEARRLMESSAEICRQITACFGEDIYTNHKLNRPLLAQRVFGNPEQVARLNSIVHPAVRQDFETWSKRQCGEFCFVESAILYESGFDKLVDEVWTVTAPEELRIARVKERNGLTEDAIRERMAAQMSEAERQGRAMHIILNDETTSLISQVLALLKVDI